MTIAGESASGPVPSVGQSAPRLESRAKVTGTAEYIHHVERPGMLHGRIVRSTEAHARVVGVEVTYAAALDGVVAVITGDDAAAVMPSPYHGPAFWDQPVLAMDRVRYAGEPIALVLADDPGVAAAGADLVRVRYEPLPPIFDEVAAATPDAPLVHDRLRPAGTFPDLQHLSAEHGTNIAMDAKVRRGDPEDAFGRADHIFEDTFTTQPVCHTPLEPLVAMVEPVQDTVVVHTSSQNPSFIRMELARLLGWPENRVRVRTAFLGGGFGAKLYIKLEAIATVAAIRSGRPVKIALPMNEQFSTINRQGSTLKIRTGVMDDGTMIAREVDVWWNNGAYADIGPRVAHKSALVAPGPYDIEHLRVDSYDVYTNRPPAGAFRGFGIPQIAFGYECQSDIIARRLGIDPLEVRERNVLRNGRPQATGTILEHSALPEVLAALKRLMRWDDPLERGGGTVRRGRGIAFALKACLAPTTSVATVSMAGDGSCLLATSTVDMGQGSDTVLAQLAGDELGLPVESIRVLHPDTDTTPYDMGTIGSRSTFHMGNAVVWAARSVRDQLLRCAASAWCCEVDGLRLGGGSVRRADGTTMTFRDVMVAEFGMEAGTLVGSGAYTPDVAEEDPATGQSEQITPFWMAGGTGIELEVDTETGRVRILRLVNVADGGRILNPDIAERQIVGAALMQLGNTMSEEVRFDDAGRLMNATLRDYKIPALLDLPAQIVTELVEVAHPDGPGGAKGLGETGTFGVSAAVGNAIHDATGVRMTTLPFNPECVLRELRAADGASLDPPTGADDAMEPGAPADEPAADEAVAPHPPAIAISFTLDGDVVQSDVWPWDNAVVALERLGIRGVRESCGIGMCGCCTITLDGDVVSACLLPAARLDGATVETVESLADDGPLHVVQEAFVECSAFQCGFCTPGWIMMTRQLLRDHPDPSDEEITHYLSGNVCRCAAYPDILRAVRRSLSRATERPD